MSKKDGKRPDAKLQCCQCKARWTSQSYRNTCHQCGSLYVEWLNAKECLEFANPGIKYDFSYNKK